MVSVWPIHDGPTAGTGTAIAGMALAITEQARRDSPCADRGRATGILTDLGVAESAR
ncbi:MAG: hypothetical protein IPO15_16840 [Anaerolineae bacterium]|uniref:hypothetical protein n=1 Tax=Candidatus Amarolinea dominans TaxID=3140696 RepID=UPI00313470BB|nr:hypothetical protein [Anaerolineae bacterium]